MPSLLDDSFWSRLILIRLRIELLELCMFSVSAFFSARKTCNGNRIFLSLVDSVTAKCGAGTDDLTGDSAVIVKVSLLCKNHRILRVYPLQVKFVEATRKKRT